jgi:hypothetical protein
MYFYKLKDFDACTRDQLKHYLKRWGIPYSSKSSTKALRRKAVHSFKLSVLNPPDKEHEFLL